MCHSVMQASKKKKKIFWKDKNKWEKNKGGIRWCPLQLQTFRLTMVERWSFIILSWLSPSHTKNATSDLPILWLCCVDGPWVINLCRKVLSHCLPVQLPPSGRWLGAQKVTAHEKKKKHKHQAPISFCKTEFSLEFSNCQRIGKSFSIIQQQGFDPSGKHLFLKCCHTFFSMLSHNLSECDSVCVCACMCLCKHLFGWSWGRVLKIVFYMARLLGLGPW